MCAGAAGLGLSCAWVTSRFGDVLGNAMDGVLQGVRPGEALVEGKGVAIERGVGGILRDCASVAVNDDRIDRHTGEDNTRADGRTDENRQRQDEQ